MAQLPWSQDAKSKEAQGMQIDFLCITQWDVKPQTLPDEWQPYRVAIATSVVRMKLFEPARNPAKNHNKLVNDTNSSEIALSSKVLGNP